MFYLLKLCCDFIFLEFFSTDIHGQYFHSPSVHVFIWITHNVCTKFQIFPKISILQTTLKYLKFKINIYWVMSYSMIQNRRLATHWRLTILRKPPFWESGTISVQFSGLDWSLLVKHLELKIHISLDYIVSLILLNLGHVFRFRMSFSYVTYDCPCPKFKRISETI